MAEFTIDYLAGLDRPAIIETIDYEAILIERKAEFVSRAPAYGIDYDVADLETDPGAVLLEESSYRETILRARGNEIARSAYLYYAEGSAVDHLAAFYDVVRLPGESDARLKLRVILAIQGRSPGGTQERYKYIAMTASLRVADAYVYLTPLDPTVHIAIFATDNNGVADAALLAIVRAALNASNVRMVNDTLDVRAAVVIVANVSANLVLLPDAPEDLATTLAAALPAQWAAVGALGRDLTGAWVAGKLMADGVYTAMPTFGGPSGIVAAQPYQAIRIGAVTLTVTGRAY